MRVITTNVLVDNVHFKKITTLFTNLLHLAIIDIYIVYMN